MGSEDSKNNCSPKLCDIFPVFLDLPQVCTEYHYFRVRSYGSCDRRQGTIRVRIFTTEISTPFLTTLPRGPEVLYVTTTLMVPVSQSQLFSKVLHLSPTRRYSARFLAMFHVVHNNLPRTRKCRQNTYDMRFGMPRRLIVDRALSAQTIAIYHHKRR